MSVNLNPYSVYMSTGDSWIGDVPGHWKVQNLRHLLRMVSKRNHPDLPLLSVVREKGVVLRDISNKDENHNYIPDDLTNYKFVQQGFFAINKMKAWQGSYGVSEFDGIVSPAYFVFIINGVLGRFFHMSIRSQTYVPYFTRASDGVRIGQWDLSLTRMCEIPFANPPIDEQTAIVRFLDHTDHRIQRYIRAKQKLIVLLEEQKKAIIHQAVTGQINVRSGKPYPAYKPSGVDWLGDVPAHWEVRRLTTLCNMKSGDGITAISIEPEGKYPVYGGNGLRGYTSKHTHCGDFALIGRQGALCGNVHIARGRFYASEHAVVATLNPSYVLEWFVAVLGQMDLNQYSIAAAQPGLAVERVLKLSITVPPLAEQARIATYIEQQTGGIDTAISHTHRQIELIQEFRTRLIADVVIGKLDVREAAANLPNDTESMDAMDVPPATSSVGDAVSRAAG